MLHPLSRLPIALLLGVLGLASGAKAAETELVPAGSVWRYVDGTSPPGVGWKLRTFDDGSWAQGAAEIGYGDGDEATVLGFGPDPQSKPITSYYRHAFPVPDPSAFQVLDLRLEADDGAVVYLNATEILRHNLPTSPILPGTAALAEVPDEDEDRWVEVAVDPAQLLAGTNQLAVELHQASPATPDASFRLELVAGDFSPPTVTRGPYLQRGSEHEVVVRWRTDVAHPSRLRFGPSRSALAGVADDPTPRIEHAVVVGDRLPTRRTYYAVGTTSRTLAGGGAFDWSEASPAPASPRSQRYWVLGDSGTGNAGAMAVRDAFLAWNLGRSPDALFMLGDNAYQSGTDLEFQTKLFDIYPSVLRNTVLWPTYGNHDAVSSVSSTETGPYYTAFSLPRQGEAGGVPSGTKAYYSFDRGDVHFVSLNSEQPSRSPTGPQLTWLQADLAANDKTWTVVFWHQSPYTKGSHNSDVETVAIQMRQNAVPFLEAAGVDLVMTGHSHSYERSFLIDGHYGTSGTLQPSMVLDGGDGDPAGDGAYLKLGAPGDPHEGTVYLVLGSSGSLAPGPLDHPVMARSIYSLGSVVLDVSGGRLEGRFLTDTGQVLDHFAIEKTTECNDEDDDDGDLLVDYPADPGCSGPTDLSESPDCSDGLDNDGEGTIDGSDPHCAGPNGSEWPPLHPSCGLGVEVTLVLAGLLLLRRRARLLPD